MVKKSIFRWNLFESAELQMSLLSYFGHSSEKAFAHELVEKLVKELPPGLMENRRKILSVNKITRLLEGTYQASKSYQEEHRIGFIKRAMLANTFKWELKSSGYPDDFVDMATEGLVVALAASKVAPKSKN